MLRIRLRRTGKKKQPSYRVVVADHRAPRDGAFIETVGHYNPRTEPNTVVLKEERVRYWLEHGAQPSDTVHRLLHQQGLARVAPPQRRTVPSAAEQAAAAAAAAAAAEAKAAAEQAAAERAAAALAAEAEAAAASETSSDETSG